jgi:hypothetical protein
MAELRRDLPPLPDRIKALPVDDRGYPVPWFVTWLDGDKEVFPGHGKPDFRIIRPDAIVRAVRGQRCWICGQRMGRYKAFVVGPMCGINRISSEPPSHLNCATFAAIACPFLARPHARRRDNNLPEDLEMAGEPILDNPGVTMVWVTEAFMSVNADDGVLFSMGAPTGVLWFEKGGPATREGVEAAIERGFPKLLKLAEEEGEAAVAQLCKDRELFNKYLPEPA